MFRHTIAVFAAAMSLGIARADDPKPLSEIDLGRDNRPTPGWLGFSPSGRSLAAIVIRETHKECFEYQFQLRVWNASDRQARFEAKLGTSRIQPCGDELASFCSDESILTGGSELAVRNLEDGRVLSSQPNPGEADHAVWSVADLKESFHLRRDPQRFGLPVEMVYATPESAPDQFGRFVRRNRYYAQTVNDKATIQPPRAGMLTEAVAMNFDRTQVLASFRDDAPPAKARHMVVLYRVKTMDDFELVPIAECINSHGAPVSAAAFSRHGRTLATGAEDGSVCLWDVNESDAAWKPRVAVERASDHRVFALTFSRDWKLLAGITWDKSKPNLLLIDVATGKLMRALRVERELMSVAFSPDGRTLLTGSGSGTIRAWDVAALLKTD